MATFDLTSVRELTKGVNKIFTKLVKEPIKKYAEFATVIYTKNHTLDYTWLSDMPSMQLWDGERMKKRLKDFKYTLTKEDYEASITVKRDDFLFDNLAIVATKIKSLFHALINLHNRMVFKLVKENGICYDGKKFFAEHIMVPSTGSTQAKKFSNITNDRLTEEALFDVISQMQSITNDQGEDADIEPDTLWIAPDLLKTAKKILGAKVVDATDNIALNLLKLKVNREMDTGTWCVLDLSKPIKPFVLQITNANGKSDTKIDEDTSEMFGKKQISYGVDTMCSSGYTFWQLGYFSSGDKAEDAAA